MKRRTLLTVGLTGAVAGVMPRPVRSQGGPHRIYRVTFRGRTAVEEGFDDYLAANGIAVEMIDRDIGRDRSLLPGMVEEIRALQPDLVTTWGTTVTLGIAGRYDTGDPDAYIRSIPVVFALVSAPMNSGLVPSLEQPGRNVTGAVHVVPTETQLRAMASYRPFRRLGVLYTPIEQNSVSIVGDLQALSRSMGFELITREFHVDPDGRPTADGVERRIAEIKAAGAEWLYLLPDTFLGTVYDRVVPAALAERLPTFGAAELAVREGGALVALVSRYYSVGQLAASKAAQILTDGRSPATIPIETLRRFSLIINIDVARELDLYPPIEMLNYAEVLTG